MKLRAQNPPHIRSRETNQTLMNDVLLALLPLYVMAAFYYGIRAIQLALVSVGICVSLDLLCQIVSRKVPNIRDQSAVVTGLLIPLLMPAAIRWEIVAAAAVFAIVVVKFPFGGVGQNVFNPAAAGVAFAMVCWPRGMFSYPMPFDRVPWAIDETVKLVNSPARTLMLEGTPTADLMDMALGNVPGPMGATHILVLLSCLLYLLIRRTIKLSLTMSFFCGAALVAVIAPRAPVSFEMSVVYELMSGLLLIGGIFLINDPVSSPKRGLPKILYGFLTGVLSMAFRHLGRFEESLLFAILMMNAAVWIIDLWGEQLAHTIRRKNGGHKQHQKVQEAAGEHLGNIEE